jgi:hypothetical protein
MMAPTGGRAHPPNDLFLKLCSPDRKTWQNTARMDVFIGFLGGRYIVWFIGRLRI